jgi:polyhydroxyalkanoate synthase
VAIPGSSLLRTPGSALDRVRQDIERHAQRARNGIKMVRGVDPPQLAPTPKDVVWSRGRTQLWRYRNDNVRFAPPLLIVYSLFSRSYLLDLQPGNSFVERLVDDGFDVFMIDWGEPDERDAANVLEDYVDGYIPDALAAVGDVTGHSQVNMLGYCFGGVLALLYGARYPEAPVRSLTTIATPIDFSDVPMFSGMLKEGRLTAEDLLDETGNMPPSYILEGFRLQYPTGDITTYVDLFENIWNDEYVYGYQAMAHWIRDHIPLPGGVMRQMADMLFARNAFVTDDVTLGGERVPMRNFTWPLLAVIAERDAIVPAGMSEPLMTIVGSDSKEMLRLRGGHVGLVVGRTAHKRTIPTILEFMRGRSEETGSAASIERGEAEG